MQLKLLHPQLGPPTTYRVLVHGFGLAGRVGLGVFAWLLSTVLFVPVSLTGCLDVSLSVCMVVVSIVGPLDASGSSVVTLLEPGLEAGALHPLVVVALV